MGVDIGTTTCKAAVFDEAGNCLGIASREYDIQHATRGRAELRSTEVWDKTQEVIREAARSAAAPVTAIGFGSMGEALVPVTADRQILGDSILCTDERGSEYALRLSEAFPPGRFYAINANLAGPQFSLPKLMWLREHNPELWRRADHFLPWSDFAAFMLGAPACVTTSHASRTLLLDVSKADWSDELLNFAGIDARKLGRVTRSGTVVGEISPVVARELGVAPGAKLVSGGHDQCCTATGAGCIAAGQAVCGMGTFQCITPVFSWPADPLAMLRHSLNIENHAIDGLYVAFLYNQAGSLVKWFRDTFASDARSTADIYDQLNAELPPEPSDLLVLPHFDPPLWPTPIADSAGAIVGLHTSTTRGEILKAIMECATLYFLPGVRALAKMGMPVTSLTAVGGGARSNEWLQITADVFGVPVYRPTHTEAGLVGAAMLAGMATDVYPNASTAARLLVHLDRAFEPDASRHAFYQRKGQRLSRLYPALRSLL